MKSLKDEMSLQQRSKIRNWCVFRLAGIEANLNNMAVSFHRILDDDPSEAIETVRVCLGDIARIKAIVKSQKKVGK